MKIYLLQHNYEYEILEDIKANETLIIGIYSSKQKVEEVKEQYKFKKGFSRYPENCFYISEYTLNENHWTKGFITWEKVRRGQRYDIPKKLWEKPLKEKCGKETIKSLLKTEQVYLLQHNYEYEVEDIKIYSTKVIGIYSTEEKAGEVKEQIKVKPGFNKYSEDCFYIDRYRLNENHWTEGFITYDGETDSWIE